MKKSTIVLFFQNPSLGISHNATVSSYFKGSFTEINECGGEIVDLLGGSRIYPVPNIASCKYLSYNEHILNKLKMSYC